MIFDFYPCLLPFVSAAARKGRCVLEVGFGSGSLLHKVAEFGVTYTRRDIAVGPVEMVNHHLVQSGMLGKANQGSVIGCPVPDQSFDVAVAIGLLYHTGNLALGPQELRRVLVSGGIWFSRPTMHCRTGRWARWPASTMSHALWARGNLARKPLSGESERRAYDADEWGTLRRRRCFARQGELREMMTHWFIEQWSSSR